MLALLPKSCLTVSRANSAALSSLTRAGYGSRRKVVLTLQPCAAATPVMTCSILS